MATSGEERLLSQGGTASPTLKMTGPRRENPNIISMLVKRAFDIVISIGALIMLLPFFAFIAIWIKRDTPGPVLYRGRRSARGGGVFHILKFRTMYERPESHLGAKITASDDPRITPIGRWLRDSKLNELPQVWNVLKGDMSLVGPRPEDPDIVTSWPEGARQEILAVRPGITSPASVLYSNEEELLKTEQLMSTYFRSIMPGKLRLDQLYVRHRSLWLDLDVLIVTLLVVLVPGIVSSQIPEEYLFWGPISRFMRNHLSWLSIDFLTTMVAFALSIVLWYSLWHPLAIWLLVAVSALLFTLLFSVIGSALGVYRTAWSKAPSTDAVYLVLPVAVITLFAIVINFWLVIFPAGFILLVSAMALSGFIITRYRSRLITGFAWHLQSVRHRPKKAHERVLIVGSGEAGLIASWLLSHDRHVTPFYVVGYVDDDLAKLGMRINGKRVIGRCENIPELVKRYDVGIIVFAIHNIPPAGHSRLMELCHQTQAKVVYLPDFMGMLDDMVTQSEEEEST